MSDRPDDAATPLVRVTEAAKSYLADQLRRHTTRDICFRLRVGGDQRMGTTVTRPAAQDVLVSFDDEVVLAIEHHLADNLRGNTIDIEVADDGRKALIVV